MKSTVIKASIDIGDNISILLQKLASQIGTTADKIYPWYIKQELIYGYSFFVICLGVLLFGIILALFVRKKADFSNEKLNFYAAILIITFITIFLSLLILIIGSYNAISSIFNPQ